MKDKKEKILRRADKRNESVKQSGNSLKKMKSWIGNFSRMGEGSETTEDPKIG